MLQGVWERLNVPYFNRITKLRFELQDVEQLPLTRRDLRQLSSLKTFTLTTNRTAQPTATPAAASAVATQALQKAKQLTPACRVASIFERNGHVDVHLKPAYFACSAVEPVSRVSGNASTP